MNKYFLILLVGLLSTTFIVDAVDWPTNMKIYSPAYRSCINSCRYKNDWCLERSLHQEGEFAEDCKEDMKNCFVYCFDNV
ncbi:hypothetical protein NP493_856g00017 [Ridgeia piscesae]|uniref:Uncharacterized protein n=1 Tax=Ridgeia piscesae TaxID=27915 RepID=A0AAD9KM05_RIDPI|nr:hypothetical protein NP493_856g00017 [Ridgeia piscesae]